MDLACRALGSVKLTGRCPVCGGGIRFDARRCSRCDVRYHPDCWTYAGGCAVYGCKPAEPAHRGPARDGWQLPRSCEAIGQQLARFGALCTRDALALGLGTVLGLAFWDLMDAYGGVFFLLWFLLGLAYLLYWPFFRARGFPVTVMHAFFLGPLVHVVIPLEIPALFALATGLAMLALGLAVLLHAWSPVLTRAGLGLSLMSMALLYQSNGRPVPYRVDHSGPEQPLITAPWPAEPVVLASRASRHTWRAGGQLERLHEIGITGYGSLAEARWANTLGRKISTLTGGTGDTGRRESRPVFTRTELVQLFRDPDLGAVMGLDGDGDADERLVVIPWWGERAPEVKDAVRVEGKLRLIVELPAAGLPVGARIETAGDVTGSRLSTRRFHRRVVAVPAEPEEVEVEYRAPGSWMMGHRLALRLAGYDPDSVGHVVPASVVELDADWMLRRLSPVVELFDGDVPGR